MIRLMIISALLILVSASCFGQRRSIRAKTIEATETLQLGSIPILTFDTSGLFDFATDDQVPTAKSVKEFTGRSIKDSIDLIPPNTDDQTLSLVGTDLTIEDGNTVDLSSLGGGGGSEIIIFTETRTDSLLKSGLGSSVDDSLSISGIPAGSYQVELVIEYGATDAGRTFRWGTSNTNVDNTVSGFRKTGPANNLINRWNFIQNSDVETAYEHHQTETIGGHVTFTGDGSLFRITWGGSGAGSSIVYYAHIKLTKL